MKKSLIVLFTTFAFLGQSCEKAFMHPEPGEDNLSLFNEYADICIQKYGLAEVKGVDLAALADSIRPLITEEMSPEELYDMMNLITVRMREGHTTLSAPDLGITPFTSYEWYLGYPSANNSFLLDTTYYREEGNPDVQELAPEGSFFSLLYGYLSQDREIGFMRINSFSLSPDDSELEQMMQYLQDAKGLIIDIRGNLGGFIEFGARLTSYFTTEEYTFANNHVKNGPGKDDFAVSEMKITPSGSPYTFTKPVMVLHDRISFSTGSIFPVMMDPLDHVTTIGQRTGGGTGEIIDGFLSNGWIWTLSASNLVDIKGRPTDPGIEPDIPVELNPQDSTKDEIIERAILEIQMK